MKKIYLIALVAMTTNAFSQGWVGTGTTMYGVNSSATVSPLSVGIGTSTPSAQFHTTGTLRFGGLTNNNTYTRVMVTDASGNVFYRDASTLSGSDWLLTGNTASSTDFIGTLNAQDFRFRTNNTQRMVITSGGTIGMNTITPSSSRTLHVTGSAEFDVNASGDGTCRYHIVRRNTSDEALIQFSTTSVGSYDWLIGTDNESTRNFLIQTPGSTPKRPLSATLDGYVFIGPLFGGSSFPDPVTRLEVECSSPDGVIPSGLNFNSLPTGTGTALVIDDNGYVFRQGSERPADKADQSELIQTLLTRIERLEEQVQLLSSSSASPLLFQNIPNPVDGITRIPFQLVDNEQSSSIVIFDLKGSILNQFDHLEKADQNYVEFNTQGKAPGVYNYSLIVNNKVVDNKKISIQR